MGDARSPQSGGMGVSMWQHRLQGACMAAARERSRVPLCAGARPIGPVDEATLWRRSMRCGVHRRAGNACVASMRMPRSHVCSGPPSLSDSRVVEASGRWHIGLWESAYFADRLATSEKGTAEAWSKRDVSCVVQASPRAAGRIGGSHLSWAPWCRACHETTRPVAKLGCAHAHSSAQDASIGRRLARFVGLALAMFCAEVCGQARGMRQVCM